MCIGYAYSVQVQLMDLKKDNWTDQYAADLSSIKEAHKRIKSVIHNTPVISSETLDGMAGRRLLFKCECFQKG